MSVVIPSGPAERSYCPFNTLPITAPQLIAFSQAFSNSSSSCSELIELLTPSLGFARRDSELPKFKQDAGSGVHSAYREET